MIDGGVQASELEQNLKLGEELFETNPKAALASYFKVVSIDPSHVEGWNQIGRLMFDMEQYAEAEKVFARVESLARQQGLDDWARMAADNVILTREVMTEREAFKNMEVSAGLEQQAAPDKDAASGGADSSGDGGNAVEDNPAEALLPPDIGNDTNGEKNGQHENEAEKINTAANITEEEKAGDDEKSQPANGMAENRPGKHDHAASAEDKNVDASQPAKVQPVTHQVAIPPVEIATIMDMGGGQASQPPASHPASSGAGINSQSQPPVQAPPAGGFSPAPAIAGSQPMMSPAMGGAKIAAQPPQADIRQNAPAVSQAAPAPAAVQKKTISSPPVMMGNGSTQAGSAPLPPESGLAARASDESAGKGKIVMTALGAIAVLGIVAGGGLWFLKHGQPSNPSAAPLIKSTAKAYPGKSKGMELSTSIPSASQLGRDQAFKIGMSYLLKKEYDKAMPYLVEADRQGHPEAGYNIAAMFFKGQGVEKNNEKAVAYLKHSVKAGYYPAMTNLGLLYAKGQGVGQDYEKARQLWLKAAEGEHPDAMHNLAVIYATGKGVEKNMSEAIKWYRKAANAGNVESMANLGLIYALGNGVKRDYAKARRLWEQAAAKGHKDAIINLEKLNRIMAGKAGR